MFIFLLRVRLALCTCQHYQCPLFITTTISKQSFSNGIISFCSTLFNQMLFQDICSSYNMSLCPVITFCFIHINIFSFQNRGKKLFLHVKGHLSTQCTRMDCSKPCYQAKYTKIQYIAFASVALLCSPQCLYYHHIISPIFFPPCFPPPYP